MDEVSQRGLAMKRSSTAGRLGRSRRGRLGLAQEATQTTPPPNPTGTARRTCTRRTRHTHARAHHVQSSKIKTFKRNFYFRSTSVWHHGLPRWCRQDDYTGDDSRGFRRSPHLSASLCFFLVCARVLAEMEVCESRRFANGRAAREHFY